VPGSSAMIASRRPMMALNRLDLPTLARPTMATILALFLFTPVLYL